MRKFVAGAGIIVAVLANPLFADALKNSLSQMIHEKETMPGMVDLNRLGRTVGTVKKSRSPKAVIAIVNGHKIRKKQADDYLKERTKGTVADFDLLPLEQRKRLIKELALPMLIEDRAKKELSAQEKEAVYVNMWIRKKAAGVSVTDEEVRHFYDTLKQKASVKSKNSVIPPFDSIKDKMKSQMIEKKIMDGLMENVNIEVAAPTAMPPMMIKNTTNAYLEKKR